MGECFALTPANHTQLAHHAGDSCCVFLGQVAVQANHRNHTALGAKLKCGVQRWIVGFQLMECRVGQISYGILHIVNLECRIMVAHEHIIICALMVDDHPLIAHLACRLVGFHGVGAIQRTLMADEIAANIVHHTVRRFGLAQADVVYGHDASTIHHVQVQRLAFLHRAAIDVLGLLIGRGVIINAGAIACQAETHRIVLTLSISTLGHNA